jgi:DNA-binding CsgD family transcriptional regulator
VHDAAALLSPHRAEHQAALPRAAECQGAVSRPTERPEAAPGPVVADRMLASVRETIPAGRAAPPDDPACEDEEPNPLSPAERSIVRLVAVGLTNRQIASRVNLSPHTVNFHLRKIFRKLGVSSRVELVGAHLHLLHPGDEPPTTPPTPESRTADAG